MEIQRSDAGYAEDGVILHIYLHDHDALFPSYFDGFLLFACTTAYDSL